MWLERVSLTVDAAVAISAVLSLPALALDLSSHATTAVSGNLPSRLDHSIRWTLLSVAQHAYTQRPILVPWLWPSSPSSPPLPIAISRQYTLWLFYRHQLPSHPSLGRGYTRLFLHSPHRASSGGVSSSYPFPPPLASVSPQGCLSTCVASKRGPSLRPPHPLFPPPPSQQRQ